LQRTQPSEDEWSISLTKMRRIVLLLTLLLIWPLAASAQIVSPGGGNYTGAITGGACTNPEFMQGISSLGVPECATPSGGGGSGVPPGDVPQLVGYSATNVGAAITLSGDLTLTSTGPDTYQATVTSVNGVPGPFAPIDSATFTGTVTMPDGAAWSSTGVTGVLALHVTGNTTTGTLAAGATTITGGLTVSGGTSQLGVTNVSSFTATGIASLAGVAVSGTMNIGSSGSLVFNGTPMGGTCAANQFVDVLSATGVPTCAAIPATLFAPLTNPSTGQNNYAALNGSTFSGGISSPNISVPGSGTLTLSAAGTLNVGVSTWTSNGGINLAGPSPQLSFAGVAVGGTCSANQFVNAISTSLVPTCANPATLFAPLTNPTGGQNNYAPLASPSFTGGIVVNGTAATSGISVTSGGTWNATALTVTNPATFNGTMTFPDASTYTTAGHNNMKALGIGAAAPNAATGGMLQITNNWSGSTTATIANSTAGANAYTVIYLNNDAPHYAAIQLGSTTATASGFPGDSFVVGTNGANGLFINSAAATAPISFYVGGNDISRISSTGLNILTGSLYLNSANQFQTGTWTPTFACASGNPTMTSASSQGYWAAVGNMVWVSAHMGWTGATGGSGQGEVGGLPFPVIDTTGNGTLVADILFDNASNPNGGTRMLGSWFNGNSFLQVYETNFGGAGYLWPLPCANLYSNSPSNARFNGWYRYR
jgi:hypothetical protein